MSVAEGTSGVMPGSGFLDKERIVAKAGFNR